MDMVNRPKESHNPDELKKALLHTVSACMDYHHYWARVYGVVEGLDETLEHNNFAAWFSMALETNEDNEPTAAAMMSLNDSADLLWKLFEKARSELAVVLLAVLDAPPDVQSMVWGEVYDFTPEKQATLLDEFFDEMTEGMEYKHSMPDMLAEFLSVFHGFMARHEAG